MCTVSTWKEACPGDLVLHRDNRARSAWQVSPKTGLKAQGSGSDRQGGAGLSPHLSQTDPPPLIHASHPGRLVTLSSQAPSVRTERSWSTKTMAE